MNKQTIIGTTLAVILICMKQLKLKKALFFVGITVVAGVLAMVFLAVRSGKHTRGFLASESKYGMVKIEGGTFMMGSDIGQPCEKPAHKVTISGFYLDQTEVTQEDYLRVMGNNPSLFKDCPKCPVEQISWQNAHDYCAKVNKRLLTEAEWEYACRAGSLTKYYWGDTINGEYAWYSDNAKRMTHPVGQKKPSKFGLYDMSGNVYEWCSDWFDENFYSKNPPRNKNLAPEGISRVIRGGAWNNNEDGLPCAHRGWDIPSAENSNVGFRCAR
jgi:formylglycine-generating enzyme